MTDDNAWVFDSLVCFLHGPVWNAPILSFIEEKSLIFDPNCTEDDNPEFRRLHDDYKNLVDFMLGSFMEEMGITPEQFEEACAESRGMKGIQGLPLPFQHGLFQQIWAANDLKMFIKMMSRRNVEIQLQALELIERRCGTAPQSLQQEGEAQFPLVNELRDSGADAKEEDHDDDDVMQEVLHQIDSESVQTLEKTPVNIQEIKTATENVKKATKNMEAIEKPLSELTFGNKKEINADELQRRQDYFKAQRDKLVAMKKQVREKQLEQTGGFLRPISAKAQSLLKGDPIIKNKEKRNNKEQLEVEDSNLQVRKALAQRLKTEVVEEN